jgi:hypothetical protein
MNHVTVRLTALTVFDVKFFRINRKDIPSPECALESGGTLGVA